MTGESSRIAVRLVIAISAIMISASCQTTGRLNREPSSTISTTPPRNSQRDFRASGCKKIRLFSA
ncbi:hypothetical protein D3C76_1814260 [compost metagenome]